MKSRIIILDYGKDANSFLFYCKLHLKLEENGYIVKAMINKKNKSEIPEHFIKYSEYDLVNHPYDFVKSSFWQTGCLNPNRYIIISENGEVLTAYRRCKLNTCMLVRFNELEYELYSTFKSPKFEKVKEKIKSN